MIGAKERSDHDGDLEGNKTENAGIPTLEDSALELDIRAFASGQDTASITGLTDGGFNERVEISAALELVLYTKTAVEAKDTRPLGVDLALEVEGALLVRDIAWGNEQGETDPEEEGVPGEECAIIEEDAGPTDEGGEYAHRRSGRRDDELGHISHTNDIGVCPNIEPNEQRGDESGNGISRELSEKTRTRSATVLGRCTCRTQRSALDRRREKQRRQKKTKTINAVATTTSDEKVTRVEILTTKLATNKHHLNLFQRPLRRVRPPSFVPNTSTPS